MTEPIGYNDDQFDDLPSEDASWQKMSRLLDKEEKRRRVIPFWWRFAALGLLIAGLGIGAWMLFGSDNDQQIETSAVKVSQQRKADRNERTVAGNKTVNENKTQVIPGGSKLYDRPGGAETRSPEAGTPTDGSGTQKDDPHSVMDKQAMSASIVKPDQTDGTIVSAKATANQPGKNVFIKKKQSVPTGDQNRIVSPPVKSGPLVKTIPSQKTDQQKSDPGKQKTDIIAKQADPGLLPVIQATDTAGKSAVVQKPGVSVSTNPDSTSIKKDSVLNIDTTKVKEAVAQTKEKTKRKLLRLTFGIAFQQPVALGSQVMSDYNYLGNKNFVADHLPGIYFTAGRDKWFASAQLNYAVPQPVEQIYFSQVTKYDPANVTLNVERYSVEKMYYHQFSMSGNYYLGPRLTAGAGGGYHLLTGAVTERELKSSNVITGESQVQTSLAPVKGYKDSFLFKSTAAAFLQSEYHWKRLRVGMRYTYSVQPYLRYTKPDGDIEDVRNNTLQLLLRFQLWKR